METLHIKPYIVKYDEKATRQAYSQIDIGDPERCGCQHCLNFAAARDKVYPMEVLSLFDKIGIDYRKESEVYHLNKIKPGWHCYGGWFHFVGRLEYTDDARKPSENQAEVSSFDDEKQQFTWRLSSRVGPGHTVFQDQQVVQINFTAKVPWVLEVEEPEEK